jgi:hypothetical protein
MRNIPNTIAIGIQSGEVTQTQDQLILPVSFNTRKTMKRIPLNPKPLFELFFAIF